MKKTVQLLGLTLLLPVLLFVSGCGGSGASADKETLMVFNWGDYLDVQVLEDFEKEFNAKIIYEEYATNEDMYVKVKAGASNYDVLFPSDYMIRKMMNENLLLPLNFDNIPNFDLIDPKYKDLAFDPENTYSVPYMWGTVGIAYNTTMVDEPVDSWSILWNEKYARSIYMLNSQRDAIAVAQKLLGFSLNSRDEGELEQVKQKLIEQKPLVASYVGDEDRDLMVAGNAALCVCWSGDAAEMCAENEDIAYAIPKEGTNLWTDSMVIPVTSQHKELAEAFINYMCRTDVALKNVEYLLYNTPQMEAFDLLDDEVKNNENFYPPEEAYANFEVFEDLADMLPVYDRVWTEILSS